MGVTARSVIVREVTEMLNGKRGEFESAEDMALGIVKHVHEELAAKKGFALANRTMGFDFVWGPYGTENEAKKDLGLLTGGQALIFPLLSVTELKSRSVTDFKPDSPCSTCRHPEVAHWNGRVCASNRCKCEDYAA